MDYGMKYYLLYIFGTEESLENVRSFEQGKRLESNLESVRSFRKDLL